MKPLLAPEKQPHPDIFENALGILATGPFVPTKVEFDSCRQTLCNSLAGFIKVFSERTAHDDQKPNGSRLCRLKLVEQKGAKSWLGNVTLAQVTGPPSVMTTRVHLQKSAFITDNFDEIVEALNQLWEKSNYELIYAYDEDDMKIQNFEMPFGASYYGITESQYDIVRHGPVEEIDTRGNPGYVSYEGGNPVTVQWLNYWSGSMAERIFENRKDSLAKLGTITDLRRAGGLQLRLAKKPWTFDDVLAHKKQLECKRLFALPVAG